VRLYIYPWKNNSGEIVTAATFKVPAPLHHLYEYLLENHFLEDIPAPADADLSVLPHAVLARMQTGDPAWEALVPDVVVAVIKERKLFGYRGTG